MSGLAAKVTMLPRPLYITKKRTPKSEGPEIKKGISDGREGNMLTG